VGTVQGCDPGWTLLSGLYSNNPGNVGSVAAYDPNTLGVWVENQNNLDWFDPSNNTMTAEASNSLGYHSTGVVDPIHKYFIIVGCNPGGSCPSASEGILYRDISCSGSPSTPANCPNRGTLNAPTLTGCANLIGVANTTPQYMGVAWDPIGNRVVVYPNAGNVIWYINPVTWTCTTETYGSVQGTDYPQNTPLPGTGADGTYGHFQYDPTFDVFLLCNDPNNDCWYLRLNR
jgi:hypothetical protein